MIEHPESQHNNLTPENRYLHNVVQLFQSAGYIYAYTTTHEATEEHLHFFKPITDTTFPRLHLKFDEKQKRIRIHLDERVHASKNISPKISQGILELHKFLIDEYTPNDPQMSELKKDLTKQCLALALFGSASQLSIIQEAGKHITSKSKPQQKSRNKKRCKKPEEAEVWYTGDQKPIPLNSPRANKDRQEDELVVKI